MTLSYDIARCQGKPTPFSHEGTHPVCVDCLRRTSPGNPVGQWHMAPPQFVGGACPDKEVAK